MATTEQQKQAADEAAGKVHSVVYAVNGEVTWRSWTGRWAEIQRDVAATVQVRCALTVWATGHGPVLVRIRTGDDDCGKFHGVRPRYPAHWLHGFRRGNTITFSALHAKGKLVLDAKSCSGEVTIHGGIVNWHWRLP